MPFTDQDAVVAIVFANQCTSAARSRLVAARLRKERRAALARLLAAIATDEDIQSRRMSMHMRGKTGDTAAHLSALGQKSTMILPMFFQNWPDGWTGRGFQKRPKRSNNSVKWPKTITIGSVRRWTVKEARRLFSISARSADTYPAMLLRPVVRCVGQSRPNS